MRKKSASSGSRRLATAAVLTLTGLTIAGCGGSSGGQATGQVTGAGGTPSSGSATSSSAPVSGATTAPPPGAANTQAAPSAGAKAARVSSGPGAQAPGHPTGFTRAGTYTYDVSGSSTSPLGHNDLAGTGTLAEDAPQGSRQHSTQSGKDGSTELTVDVRSAGLYLAEIKIASQGFDEDFRPSPAVLYFPANYAVDRQWSWSATSTDGKYTLHVTSKITGTTTLAVGGRPQKALIVDSVLHITGAGFNLTDNQRDWVSTSYALTLKEHAVTRGTAYGATFDSDVTRTLRSTTPR